MILTPLDTHPGTDETQIQQLLLDEAATRNVVVIVPSKKRAIAWSRIAKAVYDKDSIQAGVDALRAGHVGLVVLVSKYDGIDLPGDACSILAIDVYPSPTATSNVLRRWRSTTP